jgi:hypothetical protein
MPIFIPDMYHPWLHSYHLWNMSAAMSFWLFPLEICLSLCFRLPIVPTDVTVSSHDTCVMWRHLCHVTTQWYHVYLSSSCRLAPLRHFCSFLTYRPIFLRSCAFLPCHLSPLTCFLVTGLSHSHAWFSLVCRLSPLIALLFPCHVVFPAWHII